MNTLLMLNQLVRRSLPYASAIALGVALASPSGPVVIRAFYAVTPVVTLVIARRRVGQETLATVHNLDAWRIDSHSDTTLATGAAAHLQAL